MEDKKHSSNRNLDDHLGTRFETGSDEGHKWEGQEMQVNSDPLIDSGTGEKYILRFCEFKRNPQFRQWIHKQEIFNAHAGQIKTILWKDGLIPNEDVPPRVHIGKDSYKIIVLAQAYTNAQGIKSGITGTQTLQQITQNATRRNSK